MVVSFPELARNIGSGNETIPVGAGPRAGPNYHVLITCGRTWEFESSLALAQLRARSSYPPCARINMAAIDTYLLHSTVATLVLDGELWEREPYALVGQHENLLLQLENMSLRELEEKSGMLRRSLAAFQFTRRRQASGAQPLLITPTVGLELSRCQKV